MVKVLIVDDDEFDSRLISSSVRHADGDAAVSIVDDSSCVRDTFLEILPDLTLLDINMPDVDGFEILKILNTLPIRTGRAVVMLSGSSSPLDEKKAMELGADGYHIKPSTLEGYRGLARNLLQLTIH